MLSILIIILCGILGYVIGEWYAAVDECERLMADMHRGKDGGTTYPGPN